MNQDLVCPFGLKLCQDVATGSMKPLECLRTPRKIKNQQNPRISDFSPSPTPPDPPISPLGYCAAVIASGAIYASRSRSPPVHRLLRHFPPTIPVVFRKGYSAGTVTRSEAKVSKPLKGEIGGIGLRSPGGGGKGGTSWKVGEICKNAKGRGIWGWPPGPLGTRSLRDPRKS